MDDGLNKISNFIDRNLFTIRSLLSSTVILSLIGVAYSTRYGRRITPDGLGGPLFKRLVEKRAFLYGKFQFKEDELLFFHQPFLQRLLLGRRASTNTSDGIHIKLQDGVDLEQLKASQSLDHRMGKLQLLGKSISGPNVLVLGVPFVRLKCYHITRTNLFKKYVIQKSRQRFGF